VTPAVAGGRFPGAASRAGKLAHRAVAPAAVR